MKEREFHPIAIVDVDVERPLPTIYARNSKTGIERGGVFCFVRRNGKPLGVVEFPLTGEDVSPEELAGYLVEFRTRPVQQCPVKPGLPAITVVIATRDRAASLAVCLDSILAQDYPAFDLIVVDNAPTTSETAQLISGRYAEAKKIHYVRENRPGLGRAHNAGMEHVATPVVAFTDDDVIADPRWLTSLAQNFDAGCRVGCVTGLILPAELETRAQHWTERHGGFGKGFERKVFDLHQNRPESRLFPYTAGQFGSGANMAFRSDALRKIGGFDPALGAGTPARGGDDLAAFFQVILAGYRLVYEPGAIVWHHHRRGEEGMRRQAFGYGMGLGAYLTKIVVDHPANGFKLMRLMPAGLRHMMGPASPKTSRLPEDYPASLIWRERLGIMAGIPGYLKSKRTARRQDRQLAGDGALRPAADARGTSA